MQTDLQRRAQSPSRCAADLRSETRYIVDRPALLRVEGSRPYLITILDVSRNGLRVSCPEQLAAGIEVSIRLCNVDVPGEIRYAHIALDGEYHLGIRTAPDRDSQLFSLLVGIAA